MLDNIYLEYLLSSKNANKEISDIDIKRWLGVNIDKDKTDEIKKVLNNIRIVEKND